MIVRVPLVSLPRLLLLLWRLYPLWCSLSLLLLLLLFLLLPSFVLAFDGGDIRSDRGLHDGPYAGRFGPQRLARVSLCELRRLTDGRSMAAASAVAEGCWRAHGGTRALRRGAVHRLR